MSPISTRLRAPALLLLLLAASAVTALAAHPHWTDPCANPEALAVTSLIPGARHVGSREIDRADVTLWVRGEFPHPLPGAAPFRYQIVRSHDLLRASMRPVRLVDQKIDAEHHRVEWVEVEDQRLPIHLVLDYTRSPSLLIAYLQIYGNRPSANPMWTHLGGLATVLRDGAPPVTTLILSGAVLRSRAPEVEEAAIHWLSEAWRFYDRFCAPPADRAEAS